MIVQLTGLQRRALLNFTDGQLYEALVVGSSQRHEGTKWWWVEMPAIAWRQAVETMSPRLYGPRGGFLEPSRSLREALGKVQRELSRLEHHPALSRGSVMGWHHEDIPAWETLCALDDPVWYTIFPNRNGRFVILVAHHSVVRGHEITTWAPGLGRVGARTHQEAEHLAFHVGHPA